MVKSLKDFCLGKTMHELNEVFQDKWDVTYEQIYNAGTYYQVCFDNGVVVDLYMRSDK